MRVRNWCIVDRGNIHTDRGKGTVCGAIVHLEDKGIHPIGVWVGSVSERPGGGIRDRYRSLGGLGHDGISKRAILQIRTSEGAGENGILGRGDRLRVGNRDVIDRQNLNLESHRCRGIHFQIITRNHGKS